jgi:hypothetical protein
MVPILNRRKTMTSTLTLTRPTCISPQPLARPNWLARWAERRRRKRERRQLLSAAKELLQNARERATADSSYAADLEAAALAALDEINAPSVTSPAA